MFTNILIMWETPTGERKWETINSRQYKGFLEKLLKEIRQTLGISWETKIKSGQTEMLIAKLGGNLCAKNLFLRLAI